MRGVVSAGESTGLALPKVAFDTSAPPKAEAAAAPPAVSAAPPTTWNTASVPRPRKTSDALVPANVRSVPPTAPAYSRAVAASGIAIESYTKPSEPVLSGVPSLSMSRSVSSAPVKRDTSMYVCEWSSQWSLMLLTSSTYRPVASKVASTASTSSTTPDSSSSSDSMSRK